MDTRSKKRTQKEESEAETDDEIGGLDPVDEHKYAAGGHEDSYNLTEVEDEFIVRPRLTPSPFITDSVPVRHPIRMDGTSTHGLSHPPLEVSRTGKSYNGTTKVGFDVFKRKEEKKIEERMRRAEQLTSKKYD